jgi:hypothetical protein
MVNIIVMDEYKTCREQTNSESCTLDCAINLSLIFNTENTKKRFSRQWKEFFESHPDNHRIFTKDGDHLKYKSEQLIPVNKDARPPLLMVFGNPASHSVASEMFFSFEGEGREHRFWKHILKPAGVLDLSSGNGKDIDTLNAERRNKMLTLDYDSPFRIGLSVFISMPSAPGGKWGGVAGIHKLFGKKTFEKIAQGEKKRILKYARSFVRPDGAVVAFQKNAWEALKSDNDPAYSIELAKAGKLRGTLTENSDIPLYCVPPTRQSGACSRVLQDLLSITSSA